MEGWAEEDEKISEIRLIPQSSPVANPGFDITPGRLVTGLITEKGIIPATEEGIKCLLGA
jgi:methylthioribose-1-phosphate isomerase